MKHTRKWNEYRRPARRRVTLLALALLPLAALMALTPWAAEAGYYGGTLPDGMVGVPYSGHICDLPNPAPQPGLTYVDPAQYGQPPTRGIPPGLKLVERPRTGGLGPSCYLEGTPTTAGAYTNFGFFTRNRDFGGSGLSAYFDSWMLNLTIQPPLSVISTASLPAATFGAAYSVTLAASNNPTSWAATGLPPGLTLSGPKISGTPSRLGPYTVSVTATNANGAGPAKSFPLTVNPMPASSVSVAAIPEQVYSGSAITPAITAKGGNATLKANTDYTVSWSKNVNAGTATATLALKGNYTGSKPVSFTIKPKNASSFPIATIPDYTWTGKPIAPGVSVKDGNKALVSGTDYGLGYTSNTAPGKVTVTVTYKGNYTGSKTASFNIVAVAENGASIAAIDDQTYTGSAITPTVTVTDGSKTFTPGTDYTADFSNNIQPGHATVKVTFRGGYSGSASGGFLIKPKDISSPSVTVTSIGDQIYTGSAFTPAFTVKDGNRTLVSGTDYTATYVNNTDAGAASVSIEGTGGYTGARTSPFAIKAKSAAGVVIDAIPDYTYTGSAITPGVSAKDGAGDAAVTLKPGADYDVTYSNNVNAGAATAAVAFKGNYEGSKNVTFNIKPLSETGATVAPINDQPYTGSPISPAVTVTDGKRTFTAGTDYTVKYANNIETGHASAVVTFKGNYSGSVSSGFVIRPKEVSGSASIEAIPDRTWTGSPITPGVSVKDGSRTLVSGTDYTVSYSNNVDVGTATAIVAFKGDYEGSKSGTFKIVAVAENGASIAAIPDQTYTGAAISPALTVTDGKKTFTPNTDYTAGYSGNVNAGHATVKVTFRGGYTGAASSGFLIKPKDISLTSSGVTVAAVPDQTYSGAAFTPALTVRDGSVPGGARTLTVNKDYSTNYAGNVNAGTAAVTVTGLGNYTGSMPASFVIRPKNVSSLTVDAIPNLTYTGEGLVPSVTVRDGSKVLVKDTDYTVKYSSNTTPGTGTVTITGKGDYSGETTATYTILPASGSSAFIGAIPDQTYTGSPITPGMAIADDNGLLIEGRDYTLDYSNNVNVGNASVTATFQGNYTGTVTTGFAIKPEGADVVAIDGIPEHTWTGSPITPSLTVRDGAMTLDPGTDYDVSYSNNVSPGTATVTVELKGNRAGAKTAVFTITPASESGAVIGKIPDQPWTGAAITPPVTVTDSPVEDGDVKTFTPGTDYTVSYSNNVDPGNAVVTVTFRGNYEGTVTSGFVIVPRDFSSSSVRVEAIPDQTYAGASVTPGVVVKDGNKTLTEGTDYTVTYINNDGPGTGTVTITGIGNYKGEKSEEFTINDPLSRDARLISAAGVAVTTAATGTQAAPEPVSVSVSSAKPSITTSDIVPAPDASFHIYSDAGFSENRDAAVTLPVGGSSHVYVKVTAQDGVTTGYYDVTASRPDSDAGLTSVAGMGVSTAGSGASISSPQTAAVIVDRGKSSLSASEVVCSPGATVTLYTDKSFSAPAPSSIALNPGDYTHVYVKSEAQDGTSTLYFDVIVNRPNNDAGLISVAGHGVTPGGESGTYGTPKTVAVSVAGGQETITLSDVGGARDAVVHIYSDAACTQNEDQPVSLTPGGAAHVYVKVTSEDGSSTLYYDVTVNRDRTLGSSAELTSVAGTPVTPGNQAGTISDPKVVAVTTPEDKSSLSLSDIGSSSGSSVHIYSDAGFSQNQDAPVNLTAGGDSHACVKITSEDGATTLYYDVVVKRPRHLSSDAGLTSIAGQPVPAGTGAGTEGSPIAVAIGTGYGQSSVGLPDIAGAPGATVHIYSDGGFSQNEDQPVSLPDGGSAHLYIEVTAEDGTTKFYDVTDNRANEPGHSAKLTAVAGVSVSLGDEAGTAEEPQTASVVVPTGQETIALSDLLYSSGATAHIYSDVSFLHDQDSPLPLPEDGSSVHLFVTVIAEDGTTALHYDVTVARAKAQSSDAGLISVAGHAVSGSGAGGGSSSNPISLSVGAASGTASVTAQDVVAAAGATVHIYPSDDYTNNEDGAVNLPEGGSAHLYIEVTAEDNVTTKYYDVTVNRAKTPSSDAGLTTIAGRPVTVTGAPTVGASVAAAVTVPSGQSSIGPSDVGSASGSVAHIYSDGGFSQNQDAPVTLNPGENHVYIAVTAEDGGTSFYDVTVTRESPRTAASAPVPAPAPEPVPDPAADEPAASDSTYSSTNITFGGVSIDGGQHWQNLERQADGTWLVVVPWNTNLTNLALTFRLPNPATRLVPVNGTPEDFSDDRAVAYTVSSADGSNTAVYRIRAARRAFEVVDDVLLEPDGALWGLAAVWNGNGWSFTLTIPAAPSETSVTASHLPLQTYVSLDGYYTHVSLGLRDQNGEALSPFQMDSYVFAGRRDKPDALNVSAMAADLETLEGLLVDEVEWSFADEPGKSHRQYLNPPVTFDAIGDKTLVGPSGGSQRHGGGGCDGGLFPGALALALLPLLRKKRK